MKLRDRDRRDGDLAGAAVFAGLERDLLAFGEATHAGALERGRMDEHVLAAALRLDEAVALLVVVELHGSLDHGTVLRCWCTWARDACAKQARYIDDWKRLDVRPCECPAKAKRPDRPAKSRWYYLRTPGAFTQAGCT